jgi:hypothetical protein
VGILNQVWEWVLVGYHAVGNNFQADLSTPLVETKDKYNSVFPLTAK